VICRGRWIDPGKYSRSTLRWDILKNLPVPPSHFGSIGTVLSRVVVLGNNRFREKKNAHQDRHPSHTHCVLWDVEQIVNRYFLAEVHSNFDRNGLLPV